MRFLIAFYVTFIILSFMIVLVEGSNEMFGYLIWFDLIYIGIGSIGWLLINIMLKSTSILLIMAKFLVGLLVLNLIVVFLDNEAPSLTLIGMGKKYSDFWVSFFLHVLFLISFLIASLPDIKVLYKNNSKI